jgi:cyclase
MLQPKQMPRLLGDGGGLVKTVGFSQPKHGGDPLNAVRIFNEKEVTK